MHHLSSLFDILSVGVFVLLAFSVYLFFGLVHICDLYNRGAVILVVPTVTACLGCALCSAF
jgi:hypothetical protein